MAIAAVQGTSGGLLASVVALAAGALVLRFSRLLAKEIADAQAMVGFPRGRRQQLAIARASVVTFAFALILAGIAGVIVNLLSPGPN